LKKFSIVGKGEGKAEHWDINQKQEDEIDSIHRGFVFVFNTFRSQTKFLQKHVRQAT